MTKRVTMENSTGQRWDITFEGVITRRDLQKLQRLMLVEFVKFERKRSVQKLMNLNVPKVTPSDGVKTGSIPVSITPTQELLNASRNSESHSKVHSPATASK